VVELSAPSDARGLTHQVRLSLSNAGPNTRIAGYALTTVEQGVKRV
jgi:hypothetical protein